jgi:hypothetical protein
LKQNSCYTYFKIVGNFEPSVITNILGIIPDEQYSVGDKRKDGKNYDFACWMCGKNTQYDVFVENMLQKTISTLQNKTQQLQFIKNNFDVQFYLQVVASIVPNQATPALAPSLEIMNFCCQTQTQLDIDLYVTSN